MWQNCGFSDFCALHSRSNRSQFTWVNCPKFANFVCTEGRAEMTSLLHKFLHMNAADSGKSRSGFWAIEKKRFRKSRCYKPLLLQPVGHTARVLWIWTRGLHSARAR